MNKTTLLIARIVWVLYIVLVLFLCFWQFKQMPEAPRTLFGFDTDKVVHFLMFFPFPIVSGLAHGKQPSGPWKALGLVLLLFLCGSLFAAGTEIGQHFVPYRDADPNDFKADTLALAISSFIVLIKLLVQGIRSAR